MAQDVFSLTFLVDYCYEDPEVMSLSGRWTFSLNFTPEEFVELSDVYEQSDEERLHSSSANFAGHEALGSRINAAAYEALYSAMTTSKHLTPPEPIDVLWELDASFYFDEETSRWLLDID